MTFCGLTEHIFKTDLQKDKISCAKDFISLHMQTLSLKGTLMQIWESPYIFVFTQKQ